MSSFALKSTISDITNTRIRRNCQGFGRTKATCIFVYIKLRQVAVNHAVQSAQIIITQLLCVAAMTAEVGSLQTVRHWTTREQQHTALQLKDTDCAPRANWTRPKGLDVGLTTCEHGHHQQAH